MNYLIFDGKGYFVRRRRSQGRIITLWSPHKHDAAAFHFIEVAQRIAATIPQQVQIKATQ